MASLEKLASAAGDWSSRPHFAVAGDALYFTSRTSGPGGLYRLLLKDKAEPEAVTQLARHLNEALVSPDGKWLVFRRNTEVWAAPLGTEPINEEQEFTGSARMAERHSGSRRTPPR